MCAYAHVCMCVCTCDVRACASRLVCTCVHMPMLVSFSIDSPLIFDTKLLLTLGFADQLDSLADNPWHLSVSTSLTLGFPHMMLCLGYVGAGDLNSGPYACVASALLTKL